jgi:general stress protein CsbA
LDKNKFILIGAAIICGLIAIHHYFPKHFMEWVIGIIVVSVTIGVLLFIRKRRKRKKELEHWYWRKYGRFKSYSIEQLKAEIRTCKQQVAEKERSLEVWSKAHQSSQSGEYPGLGYEYRMSKISEELEDLYSEIEGMEEVLKEKQSRGSVH